MALTMPTIQLWRHQLSGALLAAQCLTLRATGTARYQIAAIAMIFCKPHAILTAFSDARIAHETSLLDVSSEQYAQSSSPWSTGHQRVG